MAGWKRKKTYWRKEYLYLAFGLTLVLFLSQVILGLLTGKSILPDQWLNRLTFGLISSGPSAPGVSTGPGSTTNPASELPEEQWFIRAFLKTFGISVSEAKTFATENNITKDEVLNLVKKILKD